MHLELRSSTSKGRFCDGMCTTTQPRGYQQQRISICSRERLQSSSARFVLQPCYVMRCSAPAQSSRTFVAAGYSI